ncbi:hypothetical protein [Neomegalonema sp.]|nr:hypothetical protein [Neomegalonema sp.]MDD2869999.1 hypothetical protein [Neomegalonema sp.]
MKGMSFTQWLVAFVQGGVKGEAMWSPEEPPMRFFSPRREEA